MLVVLLAAALCGVTWDPIEVLPAEVRNKVLPGKTSAACRVADLSPPVQHYLVQSLGKLRLPIADPGQPWNSSCVIRNGAPSRQLISAVHVGRQWVVHYRQGGIAITDYAVVLTEDADAVREDWRGTCADRVPESDVVGKAPRVAVRKCSGYR